MNKKILIAILGVIAFFIINYFYADTATNRKKMAEQVRQEASDFLENQTPELETKLRRRLSSSWAFERGYAIVEARKLGALGGVFKTEVETAIGHRGTFYRREAILTLAIICPRDQQVLDLMVVLVGEHGDISSFAISGIAEMAKVNLRAKQVLVDLAANHPDQDVAESAGLKLEFLD